jgi:hypothetical protein
MRMGRFVGVELDMVRRSSFNSKATDVVKFEDKATGIVVYAYTHPKDNKPCAIGFKAKAGKAFFHHGFANTAAREKTVTKYLADARAAEDRKAEYKAERKQAPKLKVGDILVASWGYEQTNIDFYEVVEMVGQLSVKIRKIKSESTRTVGFMSEYVKAVPGAYCSDEMVRRVAYGDSVKIDSSSIARLWDGRERNATSYH